MKSVALAIHFAIKKRSLMEKAHILFRVLPCVLIFTFVMCEGAEVYAGDDVDASYGGRLVLSTGSDPKTFNPILAQETSSTQILGFVFEGLTTIDPDSGDVLPNLAERWDVDDTGTQWTVYLRHDVFWSDGTAFTADDVVFTFQDVILNPMIISGYRSIFLIDGKPLAVEAMDVYRIRFSLPAPFAPFLRSLSVGILPRHALGSAVENNSFHEEWNVCASPEKIIGTGPFVLDRFFPGEKIILKRNTHYWKKNESGGVLPYLDEIIFLVIPSPDIALLKFRNGEIDVCSVRGMDYPWLKPLERERDFSLYDLGPTMSRVFLVLNQNTKVDPGTHECYLSTVKQSWFRNKSFRRAVAMTVNKGAIVDIVYNGLAIPQHSAMSPSSGYFFNPDVYEYTYDASAAERLLNDAGFLDRTGDGIREDANGNEIVFTLSVASGDPNLVTVANIIRKDLASVGLSVRLQQVEFNALVSKLSYSYDWDMVLMGLTGGIEPHFGANVWFSHAPLHLWNPLQESPSTAWESRVDEIFATAVRTFDQSERKRLYDEWQSIIAEEVPLIFTAIPLNIVGVRNRIGNIVPTALGGVLHNVEELFVKKVDKKIVPSN